MLAWAEGREKTALIGLGRAEEYLRQCEKDVNDITQGNIPNKLSRVYNNWLGMQPRKLRDDLKNTKYK